MDKRIVSINNSKQHYESVIIPGLLKDKILISIKKFINLINYNQKIQYVMEEALDKVTFSENQVKELQIKLQINTTKESELKKKLETAKQCHKLKLISREINNLLQLEYIKRNHCNTEYMHEMALLSEYNQMLLETLRTAALFYQDYMNTLITYYTANWFTLYQLHQCKSLAVHTDFIHDMHLNFMIYYQYEIYEIDRNNEFECYVNELNNIIKLFEHERLAISTETKLKKFRT